MSVSEMVAAASLDAYPAADALMSEADDGWFTTAMVAKAARLAVAAWATAVNGDDASLAAMADPDAAHWLLNPVRKAWMIAAGPLVTGITIWTVKPDAAPAEVGVLWRFTGRQRPVTPTKEPGLALPSGWSEAEQVFVGNMTLAFTGPDAWPWRLATGHVSTLDDYHGYRFVSRIETAQEYRRRTGTSAGDGVLVPTDTYLLDASFAEHDEKFGSSAVLEVSSDPAPTRDEAHELIWPAIWEETHRALGDGDWRPSLSTLFMIRLLGPPPSPPSPPAAPASAG
jgi:hypothetical protein